MKIKNLNQKIILIFVVLFSAIALFAAIKGNAGNPTSEELNSRRWKENGPFELSPERGRFALLYSFIEDRSFHFSLPVARFATPDLGIKNDKYVSLFAPGVSFLLIPGYLIGKILGASQVGAFSVISVFALVNFLLIISISRKIGAGFMAAVLGGFMFLFATPAFAYSTTIYQHHISVFLILLSIRILLRKTVTFWSSFALWIILFLSIPVDYPNLILSLPLVLVLSGSYIKSRRGRGQLKISINIVKALSVIGAAIPLILIMLFNINSYGTYFQFASTVGGVVEIDANGKPVAPQTAKPEDEEKFVNPEARKRSAFNFFKSRHQLGSTGILITSTERGVLIYTPVILLGIIGFFLYRKRAGPVSLGLMVSIVIFNVILYSMRSDSWGGWAFGSRYLIPSYAILAVALSVALTKLNRKWYFILPFWILLIYSVGVNALGALTTNAVPPKVEAVALEKLSGKKERYSYDRNWEFLNSTGSKSFVYKTLASKYVSPVEYFYMVGGSIAIVATLLTVGVVLSKNEEN
jgi:hypothetical protein